MSNEPKLTKEFADGWSHFCNCIDFGRSVLDAEAIQFMNEMPSRIGRAIVQRDDLLQACEELADIFPELSMDGMDAADFGDRAHRIWTAAQTARIAIAKAKP